MPTLPIEMLGPKTNPKGDPGSWPTSRETSYSNQACRLMLVSVASDRLAMGTLRASPDITETCVSEAPVEDVSFGRPTAMTPASSATKPS